MNLENFLGLELKFDLDFYLDLINLLTNFIRLCLNLTCITCYCAEI